jgi:RNA polymerase sigma factor (TIGR02999 family)
VLKPEECGGPLVDVDGRAVGLNIARAGRVETLALPARCFKERVAALRASMRGELAARRPGWLAAGDVIRFSLDYLLARPRSRVGSDAMADADCAPRPLFSPDADFDAHYRQLRTVARTLLVAERQPSLAATDLAHEAWLRLAGAGDLRALPPEEFRRRATLVMRHVLIDRARARGCLKRGGDLMRIRFDALDLASTGGFEDLLAVDEAIEKLAAHDAGLAEVVRLRFFAGLSIDEVADALGTSSRMINRDWGFAKALLMRFLREP